MGVHSVHVASHERKRHKVHSFTRPKSKKKIKVKYFVRKPPTASKRKRRRSKTKGSKRKSKRTKR